MCMLLALCKLPRYDYWSTSHFFTHLILLKAHCVHRISPLYNTRWRNNKHLLRQLPRSDNWCSSYFFTHLTLFKVYCRHYINNLYNTRQGTISICYTNYHVAISGVVATFLPILSRSRYIVGITSTTYTIRVGGTINTCYVIYRVAVGLLVGQGWERRRLTLSRLRREKTRP